MSHLHVSRGELHLLLQQLQRLEECHCLEQQIQLQREEQKSSSLQQQEQEETKKTLREKETDTLQQQCCQ